MARPTFNLILFEENSVKEETFQGLIQSITK